MGGSERSYPAASGCDLDVVGGLAALVRRRVRSPAATARRHLRRAGADAVGIDRPLGLITTAVELGVVAEVVRLYGNEPAVQVVRLASRLGEPVDWSYWLGAVAAGHDVDTAVALGRRAQRASAAALTVLAAQQLALWRAAAVRPGSRR